VILWTRCAPILDNDRSNSSVEGTNALYGHGPTQEELKISSAPICVNWKVTSDSSISKVVTSGQAFTSSDIDYTVKIEAGHLEPYTQYWYQFSVCNSNITSSIGKTKTTPRADDDVTNISVAVYSCCKLV
jgi:alkaline phosphatase D